MSHNKYSFKDTVEGMNLSGIYDNNDLRNYRDELRNRWNPSSRRNSKSSNLMRKGLNKIPTVAEIKKNMSRLSNILYNAWSKELRLRLLDLEFSGVIQRDHVRVPSSVWRLPNNEIRKALSKLQQDLEKEGYEYVFRFDDVNEVEWMMFYSIELPESDTESISDVDFECEDSEEDSTSQEISYFPDSYESLVPVEKTVEEQNEIKPEQIPLPESDGRTQ